MIFCLGLSCVFAVSLVKFEKHCLKKKTIYLTFYLKIRKKLKLLV